MKTPHFFTWMGLLLSLTLKSQVLILNEQFNALPVSWTQQPAASWTLSSGLGNSSCIYTYSDDQSDSAGIQTPTVNLSGIGSVTVSFKAALVQNNFLPPNIALSYSTSTGKQFLARWGVAFSNNTTYTISHSDHGVDYTPPLDAANVVWLNMTHTASINAGVGSFVFDAELYNAGYVVLDSVVIHGAPAIVTGVGGNIQNTELVVFPNPSHSKKVQVGGSLRSLHLINELGQNVHAGFTNVSEDRAEVDMSTLPEGIYFLEAVTKEGNRLKQKIILK